MGGIESLAVGAAMLRLRRRG
uniref:Uncharacterized protein n=1 Tax=Rhizophora mucronata TaxID=61149 RepID=A0A2P2QSI7_RHIMU